MNYIQYNETNINIYVCMHIYAYMRMYLSLYTQPQKNQAEHMKLSYLIVFASPLCICSLDRDIIFTAISPQD